MALHGVNVTDGIERFDFESSVFSNEEILQCRKLYLLFMGPDDVKDLAKAKEMAQNLDKTLLLKFKNQYKGIANAHYLTLNKTEKSQFFQLMKLSIELLDHHNAIKGIDARLDEIEREERQIIGIGEYAPQHAAARAHAKKTASSATATTTVSSGKTKKANCVLM